MNCKIAVTGMLLFLISCKNSDSKAQVDQVSKVSIVGKDNNDENSNNGNPYFDIAAIPLPQGFRRLDTTENSFAQWLLQIHLKKDKTVYLYDGTTKANQSAQFAVLDIPVGSKDLQQCADAVMRLRASFFFDQKKYDSIVFYDNEGHAYRFLQPYTGEHFNKYLQTVFGMCGTASLSKQLKKIDLKEIRPGDVLIRGGFPGHAVIVMDVIVNEAGQKKFMIAQSYMPAQSIHILLNNAMQGVSPWYDVTGTDVIGTPEYTFYASELKRW
ncbi:MAG: DUF4846 domain-containing protein [Ferruginibacter sp.]